MPGDGFGLRGLVALHKRKPSGVEHACLGVDGLAEVLRFY